MKVKIKTYNGVLPEYLTPEKEYEVIESNSDYFVIEADMFGTAFCRMVDCPHLNGGSWEIATESHSSTL